jgi:hypothetical protein
VRREAVQLIAQRKSRMRRFLISMHTYNLLSERADRGTIRTEDLPFLDEFLVEQKTLQRALRDRLLEDGEMDADHLTLEALQRHFQLLQACDNLSLLSCVDFRGEATLLHPLLLKDGGATEVKVQPVGGRIFKLSPYPFAESKVVFKLRARYVQGKSFASNEDLKAMLDAAKYEELDVTVMV